MVYNQAGSQVYGYAEDLRAECEGMHRFLAARFMLMQETKEAKKVQALKQHAAAAARAEAMAKAVAEGRAPPPAIVAMLPGAPDNAATAPLYVDSGAGEAVSYGDGGAESAVSPELSAHGGEGIGNADAGNGGGGGARSQPTRSRRSRTNSRKLESYTVAIGELREKAATKQRGIKVEYLGRDRFMNRYFLMNSLPGIHVQARLLFSGEEIQAAADSSLAMPVDPEPYIAAARPRDFTANESAAEQLNRLKHETANAVKIPWGRLMKDEDYEMLVNHLNPQGARESSLLATLKGRRRTILASLEAARMQAQFPVSTPVENDSGVDLVAKATGNQILELYKRLKRGGQVSRRNQWLDDDTLGDFDEDTWKEQVVESKSVQVMTALAKELAEHVKDPATEGGYHRPVENPNKPP